MKNTLYRIISLLLCASVTCTVLAGCGNKKTTAVQSSATPTSTAKEITADTDDVGPEVYTYPVRTPESYDQMSTDSFDSAAMDEALEQMETLCKQPDKLKQLKEAFDVAINQYDLLATDFQIAGIRYDKDITDQSAIDRYNEIYNNAVVLGDRLTSVLAAVLDSSYRDDMITYINDDKFVDDVDGYIGKTQEWFDLCNAETELTQKYDKLYSDENATITDFEQLYLELLDNRIAQVNMSEDYTDYALCAYEEVYSRDFTPKDSEIIWKWAKEFAFPLYDAVGYYIGNYMLDSYNEYSTMTLDADTIIERVKPYVSTVSEKAAAAFQTMLDLNLIDIDKSETKSEKGYTTTLYAYGVPYIFNNPYGNANDINTLIHEFGHYYETMVNMKPVAYVYDCYDVAEIDSQGMQVMMFDYSDEIYGENLGDFIVIFQIYNLLGAIVDGCIFDEFQQKAFQARVNGTLTQPAQVTELYLSVERSYYENVNYEGFGDQWYLVPHTFSSPFYYISYATSAAATLGLLSYEENNGRDSAVALYNKLIEMGCGQGFMNTLNTLGLPNPLTENGQQEIAEGTLNYIYNFTGELSAAA